MNNLTYTSCTYKAIVWVLLIVLSPLISYTQTFVGASSSPTDALAAAWPGPTSASLTVPGTLAGDLVVIYAQYRDIGQPVSISNTGGQSWTTQTTISAGNQSIAIFWCRYNGNGWVGGNPTVTVGAGNTNALTAVMYVFRPTNSANSWAVHAQGTNGSVTSASVTITGLATTVPNTVTIAFWGSENDNTWGTLTGTDWTKFGLSTQYRNTTGNDISHTAAYSIRPTASAANNVIQTQSASNATRTSIIAWMEVIPPANDLCANSILLTSSSTSCTHTPGT